MLSQPLEDTAAHALPSSQPKMCSPCRGVLVELRDYPRAARNAFTSAGTATATMRVLILLAFFLASVSAFAPIRAAKRTSPPRRLAARPPSPSPPALSAAEGPAC